MAWFKKQKGAEPDVPKRSKVAEGMWLKCNHCREIVYRKEVERRFGVPVTEIKTKCLSVAFDSSSTFQSPEPQAALAVAFSTTGNRERN